MRSNDDEESIFSNNIDIQISANEVPSTFVFPPEGVARESLVFRYQRFKDPMTVVNLCFNNAFGIARILFIAALYGLVENINVKSTAS